MAWPQIDEFRNAVLNSANFQDEELAKGEVVKNRLGLPMPWSGGIAIAYKVNARGKHWAVRTFKAETDYLKIYDMISEAIAQLPVWSRARLYFAYFRYLPKGIAVPAYRADPLNPYPIVKMEWVDGLRLDQWVGQNVRRSGELRRLADKWLAMIADLSNECIAHGDLQHGNVLVTDQGELRLVDYDGIYVPAMAGQRARELGHPNWNHPARNDRAFGDYLDQFTGLVGYTSLIAFAEKPELFRKYNNGDNLIFTTTDLRNLRKSDVYKDLMKLTRSFNGGLSVAEMSDNLAAWSEAAIDSMTLDEAISKKRATVGLGTVYVGKRIEVNIVTDPPGAMVKIDGTSYGQTGDQDGTLRVSVSPGVLAFELSCPGYESLSQRMDLRNASDEHVCTFRLKKKATTEILVIRTQPLGAEVKIEHDHYGLTIPGGLSVPKEGLPPKVTVEISKSGYREIRETIATQKTDELDYMLKPFRRRSSLTVWLVSALLGTLLAVMGTFQIALLMGKGVDILPKYWGMVAFSSGLIGILIYVLLPGRDIRGGPLMLLTCSLGLFLGFPDILLKVSMLDPAQILSVIQGLREKWDLAEITALPLALLKPRQLLELLGCRYGGFTIGIFLGWLLAARVRGRLNPVTGSMLCIAGGCLLPGAVIYKIGHLEFVTAIREVGTIYHALFFYAIPALILGAFTGIILRTLPLPGEKLKGTPWFSAPVLTGFYVFFIACTVIFYASDMKPVMLAVRTDPPNVSVFLNDLTRPVGHTDDNGKLGVKIPPDAGKVTLHFRKHGFEAKSVEYASGADSPKKLGVVALRRVLCNVILKTDPSDVSVHILGTRVGTTDTAGAFILKNVDAASPVNIVFRKSGYKPESVRFDRCCKKGDCSVPEVTLSRLVGTLRLSTNVESADILVTDGSNQTIARKTTDSGGNLELKDLPVNSPLTVVMRKQGYKDKTFPLQFSDSDLEQSFTQKLVPATASLVLKTVPARVGVSIGSRYVGESGEDSLLVVNDIPVEVPLTVELKKQGFQDKTVKLTIPNSFIGKVFKDGEILLDKIHKPQKPDRIAHASVPSDVPENMKKLYIRATEGDAYAQFDIARAYDTGASLRLDYGEAVKWYRKAADQGHSAAQNNLGVMHATGQGVPKDEKEAVKWYRRSAEQGNPTAQRNLGSMYRQGRGVSRDYATALKWYRLAAEQGDAEAVCDLGLLYEYGQGVSRDYSEAVRLYRKAAEQGSVSCQCNIAFMYEKGRGVPKDYRKALEWYKKAAKKGSARAQNNLGLLYWNGRGVPRDNSEGTKWIFKSAEQGFAVGQYNLGMAYKNGWGVAKDKQEAMNWFRRAAAQGHVSAKKALNRMGAGVRR